MNIPPCLYEQDNMMILIGEFYLGLQKDVIPVDRLEEIMGYFMKLEEEYPAMDEYIRKTGVAMSIALLKAKHTVTYL